jgi:outer membrane protein
VARANLAQFIGSTPSQVALQAGRIVAELPPDTAPAPLAVSANPLALEQYAAIASAQARLKALERTWYPQFLVQGSAYARGTGAETNGERLGGLNGLAPNTQNYAIGNLAPGDLVVSRATGELRDGSQLHVAAK